jgi:hypothetical protein
MENSNINIDMQTKSLLQQGGLEKVSVNFTENVMRKLKLAHKPLLADYKPVISKKGWALISGFMTLLIVVFIITGSMTVPDETSKSQYSQEITDTVGSMLSPINELISSIPIYVVFIPIAIVFFYGFDKLLSKFSGRHS